MEFSEDSSQEMIDKQNYCLDICLSQTKVSYKKIQVQNIFSLQLLTTLLFL